jgi:predicted aldo/keto reductase-like oxidoreductase
MKKTNRREFVKNISSAALATSFFPLTSGKNIPGDLPKRVLGRTGEKVTILGIGGFHVAADFVAEEVAIEIIRSAIDRGVNFMDNAWSYQKGRSETLMGKALKDGYRKKVLLMTKLMARTVEEAKIQLETSLKRFQLDSVDLMQFHAIGHKAGDVDAIYNDGLIEWAEDMRSQGVFKYIGFTGHNDPQVHMNMIKRGYPWDTVQMPLNIGDVHREISFENDVLPLAVENNIGIIGMKSNGMGRLGKSGIATPTEGLRYSMSLPVSTVVSGIDSMQILEENLLVAKIFQALSNNEREALIARSKNQSDIIEHYRKKKK